MKNVSGGGYAFEDRVGAWLAAALLAEKSPLGIDLGAPVRIDFMVEADRWRLDDVLITFSPDGDRRRLAASIKSNSQFSRSTAPVDFVERCWRQLDALESPFEADSDLLGLICAPVGRDVYADLQELIRLAGAQNPEDLARRIERGSAGGERRQALWSSFRSPNDPGRSPAELIARLRVIEADFEFEPSTRETEAVEWCGEALSDRRRARDLWDRLLRVVSEARTAGGVLDWSRLLAQVGSIGLRARPSYVRDLDGLAERSARNAAAVRDTIAGGVHIRRDDELEKLTSAAEQGRFVVLAGSSGVGKTALARTWAREIADEKTVVWLRAEDIPVVLEPGPAGALEHPLLDALAASPLPGWLIVDGLDRAFDPGVLAAAAHLVRSLRDACSAWGLLVTAQHQDWPRLSDHFAGGNAMVPWRQLWVGRFAAEQLRAVYEAHPALEGVVVRGRLAGPLGNAKVLDVVTSHLAKGEGADPSGTLSGESSVATWFVERVGGGQGPDRLSRTRGLLRLAQWQGDRLEPATPLPLLPDTCAEHLDAFISSGICEVDRGKVAFAHDLYGDWARYEVLRAHEDELAAFVADRRDSPLWDRAIRLYATALLASPDAQQWRNELERIAPRDTDFVHDLFVEAALYAANPVGALELLWPELEADDGRLLRRLLRRFLHVGTLPNQQLVAGMTAVDPSMAAHAATHSRVPYLPVWPPLLEVLYRHAATAITLAGRDVAAVADLWLRWTPTDWPLRLAAADLALQQADNVLAFKRERAWRGEDTQKGAWRAVLAAVAERPDAVRTIAMTLCGKAPDARDSAEVVDTDEDGSPDLPGRDRHFRDVCLDSDALHPVIEHDPKLAADILVALLEPAPRRRHPHGGWVSMMEKLGMDRIHGWFTPAWLHGPFIAFLHAAPDEALDMVLRIVDAATCRWAQERQWRAEERRWDADSAGAEPAGEAERVELVDGDSLLRRDGGGELMIWHLGGGHVPTTLASLLMAVEKWLYEQRDAGNDVGPVCGRLLRQSSSTAMVGLLTSIACRHPELLTGPLRPLMTSWQVLIWDRTSKLVPSVEWRFGLAAEERFLHKLIAEWHQLEHRTVALEEHARGLLLRDPGERAFFDAQRARWLDDVDEDGEPMPVRILAAQFDRTNWRPTTDPTAVPGWEFVPPPELAAESTKALSELAERQFWSSVPVQCRQFIDAENAVAPSSLEETWRRVMERLEAGPPADVSEWDAGAADHVACGFAALLVLRHRGWLREHPDRETWCRNTLVTASDTPRQKSLLDSEVGGTPWQWDSFCADALPPLWADYPHDPALRRAVAHMAKHLHHSTVRRVFQAAAAVRIALGDDFGRLRHLAIHVAVQRPHEHVRVADDEIPAEQADMTLESRVAEFVDGSLSPAVPKWAALAVPPRQRNRMERGIDEWYLHEAHAWIPSLTDARSEAERDDWRAFYTEALESLTRRLARDVDERGEAHGAPYEHEYGLLRALRQRILELPPELGRRLWEPVLLIGPSGHYWVTSFLDEWFSTGLATVTPHAEFVARWKEMLTFAASIDWWAGDHGFHRRELRWSLLGMGSTSERSWRREHASLIEQMQLHFDAWAAEELKDPQCAIRLASFLAVDAATPLVDRGLVWLTTVDPRYDGERYEKALESLVTELYGRTPQLARRQDVAGEAFRRHVRRLAERQSPIALEILSRLS